MPIFYTIGHSNRSAAAFLALLRPFRIATLVDVRRFPSSRLHPHFNQRALAEDLAEVGIEYVHEEALGGRRPARAHSLNTGWEDEGFRGYADYMATRPFQDALVRLEQYVALGPVVLMCAEAAPSHCHRQLIADALLARGYPVRHIVGQGMAEAHLLTKFAVFDEAAGVTYPAEQGELEL